MEQIKIIITGGTFEKKYDPIKGQLYFENSHIETILKEVRLRVPISVEILMLVDSLDMTDQQRVEIMEACKQAQEKRIIIIHGTDTMVQTAKLIQSQNLDKTIVLTGSMVPYSVSFSDAKFNLGCSVISVQLSKPGVYIAMSGQCFEADKVQKNLEDGWFEAIN